MGLQISKDLIQEGYVVVSMSRNKGRGESVAKELGRNYKFIPGDVTGQGDINKAYEQIKSQFGQLHVLINNAGIITAGGIEELATDDWEKMIDVNLNAPYKLTKKMLPLLKAGEGVNRSILNISSISSKISGSSIGYSTCKAGIDMMTRSLAKELAQYGIRVNSVNPGLVDTGFQVTNDVVSEKEYGQFLEQAAKPYPLGVGRVEDVSNLVMFLVSEKARWITGSNYVIDGGRLVN
ncbi:SDR family oxidoreductase [Bacillus alkalicola]|uniref:SDR family oxidoreductase n=2 Tax=Bacillales TaxID=1385 RepID=A0ABS6JWN6_9BACI|nr:SDR family oxidoreductase [Bacillus alkalicola]